MICHDWLYEVMLGAIAFMVIAFVVILANMAYRISRIGNGGGK